MLNSNEPHEAQAAQAAQLATRMVRDSFDISHRAHFFVTVAPGDLLCHWRDQGKAGVTFTRAERALAVEWVTRALLGGFTVFHKSRKRGGGTGNRLDNSVPQ